ncbi:MAG: serine protease [Planctomycetota bacterium]|nr:MAG: serine protease [Planctomycetota bacterium]
MSCRTQPPNPLLSSELQRKGPSFQPVYPTPFRPDGFGAFARRAARRAALFALLVLAFGCTAAPRPGPAKARSLAALPEKQQRRVAQIAREALRCVVRLRRPPLGRGSGCIVSTDGWILTAAHVVGSASSLEAILPDGVRLPARVVLTNPTNDYALCKIDAIGLPHFVFGPRPPRGATVVAVGAWKHEDVSRHSVGRVVYPRIRIPGEGRAYYYDAIFHTAPIVAGDSGGALLDERGRLVGIHGGYTTARSSVAPAWEQIHAALFESPNAPRDLTALGLRYPPGTPPIVQPGRRPRDFAESSRWTLASVRPTLEALYGSRAGVPIDALLERIRNRYLALREVDPRSDPELIRAMLSDLFAQLDERDRSALRLPAAAVSSCAAVRARARR